MNEKLNNKIIKDLQLISKVIEDNVNSYDDFTMTKFELFKLIERKIGFDRKNNQVKFIKYLNETVPYLGWFYSMLRIIDMIEAYDNTNENVYGLAGAYDDCLMCYNECSKKPYDNPHNISMEIDLFRDTFKNIMNSEFFKNSLNGNLNKAIKISIIVNNVRVELDEREFITYDNDFKEWNNARQKLMDHISDFEPKANMNSLILKKLIFQNPNIGKVVNTEQLEDWTIQINVLFDNELYKEILTNILNHIKETIKSNVNINIIINQKKISIKRPDFEYRFLVEDDKFMIGIVIIKDVNWPVRWIKDTLLIDPDCIPKKYDTDSFISNYSFTLIEN